MTSISWKKRTPIKQMGSFLKLLFRGLNSTVSRISLTVISLTYATAYNIWIFYNLKSETSSYPLTTEVPLTTVVELAQIAPLLLGLTWLAPFVSKKDWTPGLVVEAKILTIIVLYTELALIAAICLPVIKLYYVFLIPFAITTGLLLVWSYTFMSFNLFTTNDERKSEEVARGKTDSAPENVVIATKLFTLTFTYHKNRKANRVVSPQGASLGTRVGKEVKSSLKGKHKLHG